MNGMEVIGRGRKRSLSGRREGNWRRSKERRVGGKWWLEEELTPLSLCSSKGRAIRGSNHPSHDINPSLPKGPKSIFTQFSSLIQSAITFASNVQIQ